MAVRYAALCACRKVHTWRWPISENKFFYFGCSLVRRFYCKVNKNNNGTDGQTDRVRRNMRPPPREEGRIIISYWYQSLKYITGQELKIVVLSGFKTKSRSQDTGKHDFPSTSLKTGSHTCSQDRQCQDQDQQWQDQDRSVRDQDRKWQYETKCTQFTQKLLSKT